MKRLRSLVLGLFALCSMVGMAQEAEADDTGSVSYTHLTLPTIA